MKTKTANSRCVSAERLVKIQSDTYSPGDNKINRHTVVDRVMEKIPWAGVDLVLQQDAKIRMTVQHLILKNFSYFFIMNQDEFQIHISFRSHEFMENKGKEKKKLSELNLL